MNGTEYIAETEILPALNGDGTVMDSKRARLVQVTVRWKTTRGEPKSYVAATTIVKQI